MSCAPCGRPFLTCNNGPQGATRKCTLPLVVAMPCIHTACIEIAASILDLCLVCAGTCCICPLRQTFIRGVRRSRYSPEPDVIGCTGQQQHLHATLAASRHGRQHQLHSSLLLSGPLACTACACASSSFVRARACVEAAGSAPRHLARDAAASGSLTLACTKQRHPTGFDLVLPQQSKQYCWMPPVPYSCSVSNTMGVCPSPMLPTLPPPPRMPLHPWLYSVQLLQCHCDAA